MLKIIAGIEGIKGISALIESVEKGLDDMSEPLKEANAYMREQINRNYDAKGGVLTSKWQALSPEYARRKKRGEILVETGKMKKSFFSVFSKNQVEIGNKADYFVYHQSNKPRTIIPRRAMLGITTVQQTEIYRFFTKYLNKIKNG